MMGTRKFTKVTTPTQVQIKSWYDREDTALDEMWNECKKREYTNFLAETRETLIGYIQHHIEQGNLVAPLLQSLENARSANYFAFDISSYSNLPAAPIFSKKDLAERILK